MGVRGWNLTGKPPRVEHVVLNLRIPLTVLIEKLRKMPDRSNSKILAERTKYGFRKRFSANLEVSYNEGDGFFIIKKGKFFSIKPESREAWLSRDVKRLCRAVLDDLFDGYKEHAKEDPLFMSMLREAKRDFNSLGA